MLDSNILVPGGGAVEAALWPSAIPKALAVNAIHDATELIAQLRALQAKS
jgi:hypothetical protein